MKEKRQRKSKRAPVNTQCYFTQTGTKPDYKEILTLKRFTSDRGKIIPQKYTGITSKNQRLLAKEIKKARYMALLPYTDRHAI
ncbi:30S ribosomal protein S18 [candidate division WWE3 bacterium]|jgi:small subunit ribosomal protein S18|uniref:Small ribosomal subunit protein bS18 n=1 Tax=candidate division WWE3 bacterium TaxID=2053526 RepID=A0A3A4ZDZ3_UNCKA|nr:MAG: 30S ribosomal protein S18 [candidate division WWE3 bacterium]